MLNQDELSAFWSQFELETSRTRLRTVTATDFNDMLSHEMNRDIMRFIRDPLTESETEIRVREFCDRPFEAAEGQWFPVVVEIKEPTAFAGILCWKIDAYDQQCAEIGYRLHPDFHGKGYAREATTALITQLFDICGLRRIVAYCVFENESSWRLMERLGMRREARHIEYSCIGGKWADELMYAMLATEWNAA